MNHKKKLHPFVSTLIAIFCASLFGPSLRAEYECRQEVMAGAWAENYSAESLAREGMDIFPPPGPFSFVGVLEIDETGRLTVDRHTNSSPAGLVRPDLVSLFDVQITISPDCTGRRVFTLRHDLPSDHPFIAVFGLQRGEVVIDMDLVCADGQRECWGVITHPEFQIGNWQMKRVDPTDSALGDQLDRILRRLGLVP